VTNKDCQGRLPGRFGELYTRTGSKIADVQYDVDTRDYRRFIGRRTPSGRVILREGSEPLTGEDFYLKTQDADWFQVKLGEEYPSHTKYIVWSMKPCDGPPEAPSD